MTKASTTDKEKPGIFEEIVQAIDSTEGDPDRMLSVQIDDAVSEAIRAAQNAGLNASVTIALKIEPGAERRVNFSATVKTKAPKPSLAGVTLYADKAGRVHRSDPAQSKLPFHTQTTPSSEN